MGRYLGRNRWLIRGAARRQPSSQRGNSPCCAGSTTSVSLGLKQA
jgi:hypothetical protein